MEKLKKNVEWQKSYLDFFRFLEPVFQSFSACWAKYIIIQLNVCHFKQKWYKIVPNQQFLSSSFVRFFHKKCIDFKKKTEGWLLRLDFRYTCFVNVTFTFHFSKHRLLAFATLISIRVAFYFLVSYFNWSSNPLRFLFSSWILLSYNFIVYLLLGNSYSCVRLFDDRKFSYVRMRNIENYNLSRKI